MTRSQTLKNHLLFLIFDICLLFPSFCLLSSVFYPASAACPGRFVNPITDICWSCIFPISIGPVHLNLGGREDTPNPSSLVCFCPQSGVQGMIPGISIGFWEPVRLVDVTRKPFCMVNLGGIQLGNSMHKHGYHGATGDQRKGSKQSSYQVHWYVYPLIYWLELLTDFVCLEKASFDIMELSELSLQWNDDETAFLFNPEAVLFANPIAQAACAADCISASVGFPNDAFFWCGGCQGSIYPFTGSNAAHVGGVQASALLVQRMTALLHRQFRAWGTSGHEGLCDKYPMPIIKKSQYKMQMTYPIPATKGFTACNPYGRNEALWGAGREFPYKGEDFGYLIWRKRSCCLRFVP